MFDRAKLTRCRYPSSRSKVSGAPTAMGSLPKSQIDELLETAADLAQRQREIAKVLHSLGSRWPGVRAALNELNKLTH